MTISTTTDAKHRAARRPSTPLTTLTAGTRRGLAAIAASGLVLTAAATGATAATAGADTVAAPKADVAAAAQKAAAVVTTPTVTVPADVTWSVETDTITAKATPAPKPKPVPAPAPAAAAPAVDREASTASRSTDRPALAAAEQEAAPQLASASASAVINYARQFIGTPYVYGGSTPAGFDCSGFTQYVFAKFGVNLPRSSGAQGTAGKQVSAAQAQPGDLVVWPGHVGIYTGNGNHIAARNPGTPLAETPIYKANPTYVRVL
ncbi:C40 family peptidase [Georgenia ruanii]|uniref:C40 family peptidase n=1 Tax=Georgenia ruanii TaxID=348442 RepID=UPI0012646A05|nr:C40 family peptidase [Georgenia ruanii]